MTYVILIGNLETLTYNHCNAIMATKAAYIAAVAMKRSAHYDRKDSPRTTLVPAPSAVPHHADNACNIDGALFGRFIKYHGEKAAAIARPCAL